MEKRDPKLIEIWRQNKIPIIFRRDKPNPILIKLPGSLRDEYSWIRGSNRYKPKRAEKYSGWEIPVSWFDKIIERCLERYNQLFVIQIYRELQKCAPACWNAQGFHCECSCMGANHGMGHPGGNWYEVSETFAFEWGEKKYACRKLVNKHALFIEH